MTTDPPDLRTLAADAIRDEAMLGPSRDPGWMFADDPVALVRRLAATAPPAPPAPTVEPENGPAVPEARAVPIEDLIEEISAADPEFRAAVERVERDPTTVRAVQRWMALDLWQALGHDPAKFDARIAVDGWADTWAALLSTVRGADQRVQGALREAVGNQRRYLDLLDRHQQLMADHAQANALISRYEGTDDDAKLTYRELEEERDRLAVDLYRAQDCGHDLEAFGRQAETIRRWEPVIEAAKAWASPKGSTVEIDNAGNALEDAVAALGDAPDPDEFRPMFGTVSEEDMRSVAWTSGSGIDSADLRVEPEDESDGSSTADPTSPTESGQRGQGRGNDHAGGDQRWPLNPSLT